jgi:DNA-binding IclR family transcriptional regulator
MTNNIDYSKNSNDHSQDRHFVTALARGLTVLSAFGPGDSTLTNQQLAARTSLPKSTVSRLTYTLTQLGYLAQDPEASGYRPGLTALTLSSTLLSSFDMRRIAAPLIRAFALEHAISVSLGMLDGTDIVYLETCRSQARISVQLTVGSRVPLATTAIGRAYFAGLPEADQMRLRQLLAARYQHEWPQMEQRLDMACKDYLRSGFCASFGDYEAEVMAVGVALPALSPGQAPMSLNASGPAFAFDATDMQQRIAPALQQLRSRILPHG